MTILEHIFPKARRRLLSILLLHSDRRWHVRQLVRQSGLLPRAVSVELAVLEAADLVRRTKEGNRVIYQANTNSPVFHQLRDIFALAGEGDLYQPDEEETPVKSEIWAETTHQASSNHLQQFAMEID